MIDLISFWFLLPIGILIATLAMSTGISGTNFWVPVYLIWLKIDAKTSFWLALLTMIFGFGSGVYINVKRKTINWHLVKQYLKVVVPATIVGALLVPYFSTSILIALFGAFVFVYGLFMLYQCCIRPNKNIDNKHEKTYWLAGFIGAFLMGLISTGLGKLILPRCLTHKKCVSPAEAVGSVVFIVFIASLVGVVFRLNSDFVGVLANNWEQIISIMIYAAPGVLIGGMLGPKIARKLKVKHLRAYVGVLLIIVSLLMFLRVFSLF